MGTGLLNAVSSAAINGDHLQPKISTSANYKHWISIEDSKRCLECANNHGKIWRTEEKPYPKPPLHPFCRCSIKPMESIQAGTATINGTNGADWTLKNEGQLPDYYVDKRGVFQSGWKAG